MRPRLPPFRVEFDVLPRDDLLRVEAELLPRDDSPRPELVLRLRDSPVPRPLADLLLERLPEDELPLDELRLDDPLLELLLPDLLPEEDDLELRERDDEDDRDEPLRALLLDLCAMDILPPGCCDENAPAAGCQVKLGY